MNTIKVTYAPFGLSGIKPIPTRKRIYNPERNMSDDAMDRPGLASTDQLFIEQEVRSIEDILEDIEEKHLNGDMTLEEVIEELSRCGSS